MVRIAEKREIIMFRTETVSRVFVSFAGALVFASLMISAAVPMTPIV